MKAKAKKLLLIKKYYTVQEYVTRYSFFGATYLVLPLTQTNGPQIVRYRFLRPVSAGAFWRGAIVNSGRLEGRSDGLVAIGPYKKLIVYF